MSKRTEHTIWISDTHLGNPNCQYDKLLEFLSSLQNKQGSYDLKYLYLVGDIIDMTQFNHKIFWSKHRSILKKLIRMADHGVSIIYIRGNHDWYLEKEFPIRDHTVKFHGIHLKYDDVYHAIDGRSYLIIHGDQFDGIIRLYPIIYKLGDFSYKTIILLNRWQNAIRRFFGLREWSLAQWVKQSVKRSIQFINNYEQLVISAAKNQNVDGVICGHIHAAADKQFNDIRYLNSGCWVEFCSYIVEYDDGTIESQFY